MRLSIRGEEGRWAARLLPGCSWRSVASAAALALVVTANACAQGNAEPTFRKWADDSVRALKDSRSADARAKAAEYLGGFEYPDVIDAL
jgi:hypothetical protein